MIGSVAVIATVYDQIRRLHSLDTRDQVHRMLDSGMGKSLNLSVEDMLSIMHVLAMVAGGCAAACVILGWQLLRRSSPARIAVTVIAVPLWLTGLTSDGLFSTLVAVAVATLWFQPARGWFSASAGVSSSDVGSSSAARGTSSLPPQDAASHSAAPVAPLRSVPRASADAPTSDEPGMTYGRYQPQMSEERPRTLVWALVLTWVFSGLASLLMVVAAGVVLADPQEVLDRMLAIDPTLEADGLNQDSVRAIVVVVAIVVVSWCVAASVLALLVWRRVRVAHSLLIACVALSALVQLIGVFGNPMVIVSLIAAVVTVRLLLRPEVRTWLVAPR